jgi:uncharacterized protein (TIGR03435 family)
MRGLAFPSVMVAISVALCAQEPASVAFDVVSIKRNVTADGMMGVQTLPDGTYRLTNGTLPIGNASPVPVLSANIVGVPDWAKSEHYDVVARPPAGSTAEQRRLMWQNLFATRMKLAAHIEQREVKAFALVLARDDGRLGPELKKSALDCGARGSAPDTTQPGDKTTHCGILGTRGSIVSGGITMDMFARNQVTGRAGGPVTNRTGLEGYYAFILKYAEPGPAGGMSRRLLKFSGGSSDAYAI